MGEPTKIAWEIPYDDRSGVNCSVSLDVNEDYPVSIVDGDRVATFRGDQVEWLIDCLMQIKQVIENRSPDEIPDQL